MSILSKAAKPKKRIIYRKGYLRRSSAMPEGLYGLELEVEGHDLPAGPEGWTSHNDGSLRGENLEYVLARPLDLEPAVKALHDLFLTIKKHGAHLNESNRTSFHVHVNMRNFNIVRTAKLITLYGIFENLLTNWCGEYRVGNLFAQRMCDSAWIVTSCAEALRSNSFANLGNDWRYAAMNLASINKFGSIEFRAMRGITNADDGITWLSMLNKLVEACDLYQTPVDIVQDFSGRELDMLQKIFGTDLANQLEDAAKKSEENVQHMLWKGVRIVQDVAYALDWNKVLDELGQPYIPDPFEKETAATLTTGRALVQFAVPDVAGEVRLVAEVPDMVEAENARIAEAVDRFERERERAIRPGREMRPARIGNVGIGNMPRNRRNRGE